MNLRRRKKLRRDVNGQFPRELGWKSNGKGKLTQPKFYLGTDEHEAELRNRRLEQLWSIIEDEQIENGSRALWDDVTLDIGKAIAKGKTEYFVPNSEELEQHAPGTYGCFVRLIRMRYSPVIAIRAEDENVDKEFDRVVGQSQEGVERSARFGLSWKLQEMHAEGPFLYQALDTYCKWIEKEYVAPAENGDGPTLTDWGRGQLRNIRRLKERHPDIPLAELNQDAVNEMVRLWRQRPTVKGKSNPMKPKSVKHHIKQIFAFLNWLHENKAFDWELNFDLSRIRRKVEETRQETVARYTPIQAQVYTLDELRILNQYATAIERFALMLGLNCAAGNSEIAGLLLREIYLREAHPHADFLRFASSEQDCFIKGPRPKTGVYGEFLLWQETVRAVEWAIVRRQKQTRITQGPQKGVDITPTPDSHLFLTEQGYPLTRQTSGGNRIQRIPNIWDGLLRRVRKDHPDFRKLSFGKLRKTAGDLVKHFSNGEVAGVFLRHGNVVKTDDLLDLYTNRSFGKLFRALREVEKHLQPMFDAAPEDPFPEKRKKGGPNITLGQIRRIRSLRKQGFKVKKIAELVGVTTQTVHRHSKRKK